MSLFLEDAVAVVLLAEPILQLYTGGVFMVPTGSQPRAAWQCLTTYHDLAPSAQDDFKHEWQRIKVVRRDLHDTSFASNSVRVTSSTVIKPFEVIKPNKHRTYILYVHARKASDLIQHTAPLVLFQNHFVHPVRRPISKIWSFVSENKVPHQNCWWDKERERRCIGPAGGPAH